MGKIEQVLDIFQGFRMNPTPIDQYETVGKEILGQKISSFISKGEKIEFVMLGYPMKSANDRDKVIGKLPDMAEEVSLRNFEDFNRQVQNVYSPGVEISIVNDGYVFNDLLGIPDSVVQAYQEVSMDMGRIAPMNWYNLSDFYTSNLPSSRDKLINNYGITWQELEQRILMDPDVNYLYRGMIRFMEEELAIRNYPSRNQLNKAAKLLTRNMMMRNEAYSNLVKDQFSSHIRLSMHPSVNNGNKYSFELIPGGTRSPWHCVLVVGDVYQTLHKKEAEQKGYRLVYKDNRPYYYENRKSHDSI